jgi:hypothetical protein
MKSVAEGAVSDRMATVHRRARLGSRDVATRALWTLPHDVRRALYRRVRPSQSEFFDEIRAHDLGEIPGQAISLVPFDRHQCIFVHIPKCAGISVGRSLFGDYGGGHFGVTTYEMIFTKAEFDAYFKFAVVRNPWDRVLSGYRFLRGVYQQYLDAYGRVPLPSEYDGADTSLRTKLSSKFEVNQYEDFEAFVLGWINPGNLRAHEQFRPQHRFVCDPDGTLRLDYVARFENLATDFATISERLGIMASLRHDNRSAGVTSSYRDHYTPAMRKVVADHFARDIELFGYGFDDG